MPMKNDREYRDMTMEIRSADMDGDRMIVQGYASTFDSPYTLYEDEYWRFDEIVDRKAFDNTDMSDVIMQYDHEGRVFARITNGTLEVSPDEVGLLVVANLEGTELGRQLYEEIKGGYTTKMSFGFTVDGQERTETKTEDGKDLTVRTITSIRKLYDVSAVSIPANDGTSISIRNLANGEIERIKAERLEEEKRNKQKQRIRIIKETINA